MLLLSKEGSIIDYAFGHDNNLCVLIGRDNRKGVKSLENQIRHLQNQINYPEAISTNTANDIRASGTEVLTTATWNAGKDWFLAPTAINIRGNKTKTSR